MFEVEVPFSADEAKVIKAFNELFHVLDVLPEDTNLGMGDAKDYCAININYDRETYSALFNVPSAKEFRRGDEEYQYSLKVIHGREMADRIAESGLTNQWLTAWNTVETLDRTRQKGSHGTSSRSSRPR